MKLLLVYPPFLEKRTYGEEVSSPPLGLFYVAAVLKDAGYEPEILNAHEWDPASEKVRQTLAEKNPDLIGFSILHGNRWGGIEIARTAKAIKAEVVTVFGGIGATFLWEHLLTHFAEIDYVVLGEGEYVLLQLVRRLEGKDPLRPEEIPGLAFRKDGRPMANDPPPLLPDLDRLPDPSRHFTFQHVAASRGCAWNCTFCGSPRFWGRRPRFYSPTYLADQLERLNRRGVRFFFFSDDTFTLDKKRALAVCRAIADKGLKIAWNAISRVDRVDEELLYWMRKAGCIQISYGLESGDETIRRRLNKPIKTEDIKKAFALTVRYGILARAYFIYGAPGETEATIQATLDLIREIKPLSAIFYILDLFPGTELYERLKAKTGLRDDLWLERMEGIMHFETDPRLSDEQILAWGRRLRRAFDENVHDYAAAIRLLDQRDLYEGHADFLSRLGMTFSQGDYARRQGVREKEATAERLFRQALDYAPHQRAFLGLGMLKQRAKEFQESIRILKEGLRHHPDSPDLHLCLGLNYMNLRDYKKALECFEKFPDAPPAGRYASECQRHL